MFLLVKLTRELFDFAAYFELQLIQKIKETLCSTSVLSFQLIQDINDLVVHELYQLTMMVMLVVLLKAA